jgi:chromosome partitioning ATPase
MSDTAAKSAHVIVVSNEKGGTGKSTICMHLAIKLLQEGFSVATFDLDGRQGTLTKYIENRKNFRTVKGIYLPTPEHFCYVPESNPTLYQRSLEQLNQHIRQLSGKFDAIVIDTPGNKNYLFEEAHKFADTLITPISDSLIDLSVMADIDFTQDRISGPGPYSEFIWEIKKYLAAKGKPYLNWIVVGNKFSSLNSRNKNLVFAYLDKLSKLYGFRFLPGLKDRVIYKELFLEGLTVLDMSHDKLRLKMSMSHLAAKHEIKNLAEFICPDE